MDNQKVHYNTFKYNEFAFGHDPAQGNDCVFKKTTDGSTITFNEFPQTKDLQIACVEFNCCECKGTEKENSRYLLKIGNFKEQGHKGIDERAFVQIDC